MSTLRPPMPPPPSPLLLVLLFAAVACSAPPRARPRSPEAEAFLTHALAFVDRVALFDGGDRTAWQLRVFARAAGAQTPADCGDALRAGLAELGDWHSRLQPAAAATDERASRTPHITGCVLAPASDVVALVYLDSPAARAGIDTGDRLLAADGCVAGSLAHDDLGALVLRGQSPRGETLAAVTLDLQGRRGEQRRVTLDLESTPQRLPTARRLPGDIGYLELPGDGGGPLLTAYAEIAHLLLQQLDAVPVRGWIVDVRRNFGGNPWPMFAALAPLLGDELLGGMHTTRGSFPWRYAAGTLSLGDLAVLTIPEPFTPATRRPVVLLTGPLTISAGEALVIASRNRPHMATVGEATFGLTTTTRDYCLLDSSVLTVSDGVMADNRGEPQWGPLAPELRVPIDWTRFCTDDDPCIIEAQRWISRQ